MRSGNRSKTPPQMSDHIGRAAKNHASDELMGRAPAPGLMSRGEPPECTVTANPRSWHVAHTGS